MGVFMSDSAKKDDPGFTVVDKRRFTNEGDVKKDVPDKEQVKEEPKPAESGKNREIPEMDFSTFVLSLAASAQVHLGAIANPATGKSEKDIPLAKQTIDIIGMLEAKTKGNLSEPEKRLLEHVLYDLRMMFVQNK